MPILVPGPDRLPHTGATRAVRQTKPLTAWTPRPSLYGTPPKICLPGQAPAISKKCPYLTGLAKHRESGLVVDKTEAVTRALTFTGTAPPTKTRRQQERSTTGTGSMTEKRKPGARESFQTGNKTLVSSIGDNWALRKEVPMPIAQDLIERARMFEERAERRATQFPTALRRNGRSLSSAVRRASGRNKAGTRIGALRETGASLVPIFGNGSV
jgi:hypothetical protein